MYYFTYGHARPRGILLEELCSLGMGLYRRGIGRIVAVDEIYAYSMEIK